MVIVSAESVYKTYRLGRVDVPVLRGVDLEIRRGEWVAILGASGSGKSTLMHILGGLDRPDRFAHQRASSGTELREKGGRVVFDGRSLSSMSSRELDRYRNRSVGFVFQFYHLLPELTVLNNVLIAAMIRHGLRGYLGARGAAREHAEELLASFGLSHRLHHRPSQLSGGERQRVAIARALINDPQLLLADEPTGNLDRKTGRAILDALATHREQTRRTMVIVTHDAEVAQRADRVVHLEDGLIASQSSDEPPPSPSRTGDVRSGTPTSDGGTTVGPTPAGTIRK